jgi:hypothetical protein
MKICKLSKSCKVLNCKHKEKHEETDQCILTLCSRKNALVKCINVKK